MLAPAGERTGTLLRAVSRVKNGASPEDGRTGRGDLCEAYCARLEERGTFWTFDDLLIRGAGAGHRGPRVLLTGTCWWTSSRTSTTTRYALVQGLEQGRRVAVCHRRPGPVHLRFPGGGREVFPAPAGGTAGAAGDPAGRELPLHAGGAGGCRRLSSRKIRAVAAACAPTGPPARRCRMVRSPDAFSEGVFLAKEIGRMTGGVDMLEAQALGHERTVRAFSDIAVLCRTHRQLELVEKCLRHDDIPCVVSGREVVSGGPPRCGVCWPFFRSPRVARRTPAALETALGLLWDCPGRPDSKSAGGLRGTAGP